MGCDIHFRVEFFAPGETVVPLDGDLKVVPGGEPHWQPAERMVENEDRKRYLQMAADFEAHGEYQAAEDYRGYAEYEPVMEIAYGDRFYSGRNYGLFERLSGVRGADRNSIMFQIDRQYGLPKDCCPEIAEDISEDDGDLHSHTWYTLTELIEAGGWNDFDTTWGSAFSKTITDMQAVAIERCGGNTDHVRAVMAYDN